MVQRVTYRRRHSYHTTTNTIRKVRTPGGNLNVQYVAKKTKGARCGDCGCSLPGIKHLRNSEYHRISRPQKSVSRAYGGSRCHQCVRQRIIRAFLIEEQKIVKRVVKAKQGQTAASK
eukprot:TRINITY_DN16179_c0_g1_i1.p1 TRINITY_DN16179_c0_g1~~TRINITY_DN16179_c0_g1_i1.p1  ORF type:complete len:117 (+),score=17.63 TRINITY_DN16179_c0_g1_i1:52-402(+)